MRDDHRATTTLTAPVIPADPVALHRKRRTLFVALLGAVLLPALVAAVLPNANAEDIVFVAAEVDPTTTQSDVATSATPASTTTAVPTTVAPRSTTTAKPKATTTTTKPKPAPTTTTPKPVATAPAPAPVAAPPAPTGSGATAAEAAFLACVRQRESGGNYGVVSSNGLWYGAYQMTRQTWDSVASRAGRPDLVGVPPNQASPADQDHLALVLYRWLGKSPWGGAC
jgi:cytoskeletal protein RodZ